MHKRGFHKGFQRFGCKQCGKSFSDIPERPLDTLRVEPEKAYQVINLLAEGVGIRAIERLAQLNRRTVLGILETAGEKCERLLDNKLRNLKAEQAPTADHLSSKIITTKAHHDHLFALDHSWIRV